MKDRNYTIITILFILVFLLILVIFILINNIHLMENLVSQDYRDIEEKVNVEEIAVQPPPFTEGIFPCSECHADMEVNTMKRELGMHEEITSIFDHDAENRWCLDCHDAYSRDSLRLASGQLLDFKESYKLCGQCHGDKYMDWKIGIHGKRIGEWNGKKYYFLCVHCHNPHSPGDIHLKPDPPPVRQEEIKI